MIQLAMPSEEEWAAMNEDEKDACVDRLLMSIPQMKDDPSPALTMRRLAYRRRREVSLFSDPDWAVPLGDYKELAMRELEAAEKKARMTRVERRALRLFRFYGTYMGVARAMRCDRRTAGKHVHGAMLAIKVVADKWWGWWEVYLAETRKK